MKELKLDDKTYKSGLVQSRISSAKNNLITPQAYANDVDFQKSDLYAKVPLIRDIYAIYCNRCKQADAMDFDDLLLQTNVLFRNNPEILQKYQQIFKYILVDEYQDTNFAQYLIVKKLAELHEKICVVGDDAQSIYSFRGANIDNILQFKNTYPSAQVFKLERNYRSTQTIVNAANSLIDKNSAQIKKTVFSEKEQGELIKITNVFTDLEEGTYVAETIKRLHKKENYGKQFIAKRECTRFTKCTLFLGCTLPTLTSSSHEYEDRKKNDESAFRFVLEKQFPVIIHPKSFVSNFWGALHFEIYLILQR